MKNQDSIEMRQGRLVIWCRTCVDWANMTINEFNAQELTEKNHKEMIPVIKLWDSLFSMTYFDFRAQLNCIAKYNWKKVTGVSEILEGRVAMNDLLNAPGDPVIVPVDDDDWFAPNLGEITSCFKSGASWIAWNDAVFNTGFQRKSDSGKSGLYLNEYDFFKIRYSLSTNNSEAVSKTNSIAFYRSGLPQNYPRSELLDLLGYHARVGLLLSGGQKDSFPNNFYPAMGRYSLINRNMASISLIFPRIRFILNNPGLFHAHACKVAEYNSEKLPVGYEWARNNVQNMCDLYRELVD